MPVAPPCGPMVDPTAGTPSALACCPGLPRACTIARRLCVCFSRAALCRMRLKGVFDASILRPGPLTAMLPPACPCMPAFWERLPGARRSPALLCARLASLCVAVLLPPPPLPSQALLAQGRGLSPSTLTCGPTCNLTVTVTSYRATPGAGTRLLLACLDAFTSSCATGSSGSAAAATQGVSSHSGGSAVAASCGPVLLTSNRPTIAYRGRSSGSASRAWATAASGCGQYELPYCHAAPSRSAIRTHFLRRRKHDKGGKRMVGRHKREEK